MVVFPQGRSIFLGRHKSLNYLFYLTARQYALDRGAKEALILEADGLVSEGSATSLVYLHRGSYYTPAAASASRCWRVIFNNRSSRSRRTS